MHFRLRCRRLASGATFWCNSNILSERKIAPSLWVWVLRVQVRARFLVCVERVIYRTAHARSRRKLVCELTRACQEVFHILHPTTCSHTLGLKFLIWKHLLPKSQKKQYKISISKFCNFFAIRFFATKNFKV